jgi:hypothetical protein
VNSCLTNAEFLRLETQKLPESQQKYTIGERIPAVISSCEECLKAFVDTKEIYDELDSRLMKTSTLLLALQKSEARYDGWKEQLRLNQEAVLKTLDAVRSLVPAQTSASIKQ